MIGCDMDAVGDVINLPGGYVPGMMIAIGKGITPPQDKDGFCLCRELWSQTGSNNI